MVIVGTSAQIIYLTPPIVGELFVPGRLYCHVTSAKVEILRSLLSFVLSVCEQNYCKIKQPISLKLGVRIVHSSRKNWLTFGGDSFPDMDFDHFSTSLTIAEDLLAFIVYMHRYVVF